LSRVQIEDIEGKMDKGVRQLMVKEEIKIKNKSKNKLKSETKQTNQTKNKGKKEWKQR
jgi:hypothetical protein